MINDDLRAVAELFAFVAANPNEALGIRAPAPWHQLTSTHEHVLALAGDSHLLRTRQVKQGQRRGDLRQGVVVDVLAVVEGGPEQDPGEPDGTSSPRANGLVDRSRCG